MGIKKLLTNITNAVSNRALDLRKLTNKEALLDEYLNLLSKLKLLSLEPKGNSPEALAKLAINLLLIRNARELRKLASSAEKDWIRQNADKATKVYKSGTKEFGGASNKLALQKAREAAINPYLDLYLSFSNLISGGSSLIKKMGKEDAKTIKKASSELLKDTKNLPKNTLNFIKKNPKAVAGTAGVITLAGVPAYNYFSGNLLDNIYPFGYYDADSRDPNPGPVRLSLKASKKLIGGLYGFKSEARKDFDTIALADLSDPELLKLAKEIFNKSPYLKNMFKTDNISTELIKYLLKIYRVRTDLNNLYLGRDLQYDSMIPNTAWQSIASKENPDKITWTFKDPLLRLQYRNLGAAYNMLLESLPEGQDYIANGVSDNNGVFGNFSIVKNKNNNAGKYIDVWDFKFDNAMPHKDVIVGDTILASKKSRYHNFGPASEAAK